MQLQRREQEVRLIRAIKMMRNRETSKAFASWISYVSIRRRFRKYAKRMSQRKTLAVFNTWIEFLEERIEMRDQVQRVVSKIVSRKLAMGFASWKQHFQLLVQTEQAEANRTRRMKTVLRRLESRLLSKSYKKWQYEFRQQKRLKKFLRRWLKRSQGRAFEGWINFVEERVQTRRLMTRVMARMQRV